VNVQVSPQESRASWLCQNIIKRRHGWASLALLFLQRVVTLIPFAELTSTFCRVHAV